VKDDKDGAAESAPNPSPDPTPKETPFERFTEFARKIISVPRAEIEEQERLYQQTKKRRRPKVPPT
jgi:hypothetical protein